MSKENLQKSLEELEKIVKELEDEDINVEESLRKFKKGVSLIKDCRSKLEGIENDFEELKKELEEETN